MAALVCAVLGLASALWWQGRRTEDSASRQIAFAAATRRLVEAIRQDGRLARTVRIESGPGGPMLALDVLTREDLDRAAAEAPRPRTVAYSVNLAKSRVVRMDDSGERAFEFADVLGAGAALQVTFEKGSDRRLSTTVGPAPPGGQVVRADVHCPGVQAW